MQLPVKAMGHAEASNIPTDQRSSGPNLGHKLQPPALPAFQVTVARRPIEKKGLGPGGAWRKGQTKSSDVIFRDWPEQEAKAQS